LKRELIPKENKKEQTLVKMRYLLKGKIKNLKNASLGGLPAAPPPPPAPQKR